MAATLYERLGGVERDHAIAQALDDMINATTRATRQDRRGA